MSMLNRPSVRPRGKRRAGPPPAGRAGGHRAIGRSRRVGIGSVELVLDEAPPAAAAAGPQSQKSRLHGRDVWQRRGQRDGVDGLMV